MTMTEPRLFPCDETPTVVRLPATALVRYVDDVGKPSGTFVALDIEALIAHDSDEWERTAHNGAPVWQPWTSFALRLEHFVRTAVDVAEATGEPFRDWAGAIAWSGEPRPEMACSVDIDTVALRKALAFELRRKPWAPVDELALVHSATNVVDIPDSI